MCKSPLLFTSVANYILELEATNLINSVTNKHLSTYFFQKLMPSAG